MVVIQQHCTSKDGVGMTAMTESRVPSPMLPINRPTCIRFVSQRASLGRGICYDSNGNASLPVLLCAWPPALRTCCICYSLS